MDQMLYYAYYCSQQPHAPQGVISLGKYAKVTQVFDGGRIFVCRFFVVFINSMFARPPR